MLHAVIILSVCATEAYERVCVRGNDVIQPKIGGLLEISSIFVMIWMYERINSSGYLEKEVGDLMKHV